MGSEMCIRDRLMRVKDALMTMNDDLDGQAAWISASLCDGEDEKSEQLKEALDNIRVDTDTHKKCLRIRAMVENIVHALLRVEAMTQRMNTIFIGVEEDVSPESEPHLHQP